MLLLMMMIIVQPTQITVGAHDGCGGSGDEEDATAGTNNVSKSDGAGAADTGFDDTLLLPLKTSKRVTRYRCKDCGCPVVAKVGGSLIVIPFAAIEWDGEVDESWRPQHHL